MVYQVMYYGGMVFAAVWFLFSLWYFHKNRLKEIFAGPGCSGGRKKRKGAEKKKRNLDGRTAEILKSTEVLKASEVLEATEVLKETTDKFMTEVLKEEEREFEIEYRIMCVHTGESIGVGKQEEYEIQNSYKKSSGIFYGTDYVVLSDGSAGTAGTYGGTGEDLVGGGEGGRGNLCGEDLDGR